MNLGVGVSRLHFPIRALGPGRRIGLWLQGCTLRCAGCMSRDTWAKAKRLTPVHELLARMSPWFFEADGITISGGEPFDQPQALATILAGIGERFGQPVMVYTGHSIEHLRQSLISLDGIDVLISGPYDEDRPGALLRGSDNQRVDCLTAAGAALWRQAEEEAAAGKPRLDAILDDDGGLWFAGVPAKGDLQRLGSRLTERDINAATSYGKLGVPYDTTG